MKKICVFNQKGGVGKTTTVVNLSSAIAKMGKKVLVIDIDPQANATSGFGIAQKDIKYSIYDLLTKNIDFKDSICKTELKNVDIIPSSKDLAAAEVEFATFDNRNTILKEKTSKLEGYDYVFIDCPPSLGLLSINALSFSNSIFIPIQCEYYALEGVSQLINTLNIVKKSINKNIYIEGVLITMYDRRNNLSSDVTKEARKFFKNLVYKTVIPRNIRLAEAPSFGKNIMDYAPKSQGAITYMLVAKEFLKRNS